MIYNLLRFISLFMLSSEIDHNNYTDILLLEEYAIDWENRTVTLGSQTYTVSEETLRFLRSLAKYKPKEQLHLFIY
ncbi:hypothetical protein BIV59_15160 [Bacillus sp. MUM 13]|nr:hypothetical protein BIV59_15160 [Bacillus sp. MUM 13]